MTHPCRAKLRVEIDLKETGHFLQRDGPQGAG